MNIYLWRFTPSTMCKAGHKPTSLGQAQPSPETRGSSEVKELSLALRLLTEVRWMHW